MASMRLSVPSPASPDGDGYIRLGAPLPDDPVPSGGDRLAGLHLTTCGHYRLDATGEGHVAVAGHRTRTVVGGSWSARVAAGKAEVTVAKTTDLTASGLVEFRASGIDGGANIEATATAGTVKRTAGGSIFVQTMGFYGRFNEGLKISGLIGGSLGLHCGFMVNLDLLNTVRVQLVTIGMTLASLSMLGMRVSLGSLLRFSAGESIQYIGAMDDKKSAIYVKIRGFQMEWADINENTDGAGFDLAPISLSQAVSELDSKGFGSTVAQVKTTFPM